MSPVIEDILTYIVSHCLQSSLLKASVANIVIDFSFSYVELATRRIAAVAKTSKIVVEKSTVPCRTAESMRTILEANSKEPEVKSVYSSSI